MILTVLLLLAVFGTGEATNLTTDQILNASFDSTNGSLKVQNGAVKSKECTVADGDATPDVAGCRVMKTSANTGATAITDYVVADNNYAEVSRADN